MRFYEYETKELFRRHGIPLVKHGVAYSAADARRLAMEIGCPVVMKSQVLSGGRMKAGAVKFADTPEEAEELYDEIFPIVVRGQKARGVLVEEKVPLAKQFFIGITWDSRAKLPVLVVTDLGGIDVEEEAEKNPDHVTKTHLSTILPCCEYKAKDALWSAGIRGRDLNRLVPLVTTLTRIFLKYDLTLCEVNPLVQTTDGHFYVLDGHIDMEAEARDRHAKLLEEIGIRSEETRQARPPTEFEIRGVEVNEADHRGVAGNVVEFEGDLGLIIGAGGGSLTLFDAIRKHGGRPANYCEIGGNPSVNKTKELTKLILSKPGVKKISVMMNVVSNTRVDIIARGVIKGCVEMGRDPSKTIAMFRIPGAWEEEGAKILKRYGVDFSDRSVSMNEAAKRTVENLARH